MGRKRIVRERVEEPVINPHELQPLHIEMAVVFAKMLHVGCPPVRAVLYCFPMLTPEAAKVTAADWLNRRLVHDELAVIQGGRWMDLPLDARLKLAREKHVAEMGYYLWSTNFNDIEHKEGLDKMRQAREVLAQELGLKNADDDALAAFSRFALDLVKHNSEAQALERKAGKTSKSSMNPALQPSAVDQWMDQPQGKA